MPRRPRRRPLNKDEMIALWAARGGAPAHYSDPTKYLTEDRYHPVRPVLHRHKTKGWKEMNRRGIPLPPPRHHPHRRNYEDFDGPAATRHSLPHGFHRRGPIHRGPPRVRMPTYNQPFWDERDKPAQTTAFGNVQYVGRYDYPRKDRKKAAKNVVYVYSTRH